MREDLMWNIFEARKLIKRENLSLQLSLQEALSNPEFAVLRRASTAHEVIQRLRGENEARPILHKRVYSRRTERDDETYGPQVRHYYIAAARH